LSGITTHVLDTSRGRPAAGVPVTLERAVDDGWETVGHAATNAEGRAMLATAAAQHTRYRLTFDTGAYFRSGGERSFYPEVAVTFTAESAAEHYHVPLLLSAFGYSTYRGS
jgi:5-hydroxyisourate hydrolase